jgi:hypothetical protein
MPWYPKAILAAIAILVLLFVISQRFRDWASRVDVRWLIAFHFIRFVGIYFLYLYAQHELPFRFAVWGGSGDIIVAMLALIAMRFASFQPGLILWNVLGLVDIIAVAVTAAQSEIAVPGSMHQLDKFPLILLPICVVPVAITTHGLMLIRAFRSDTQPRY